MRHSAVIRRLALGSTACSAALALLAGGPAAAATCQWTGGAGDWNAAAMWSCGVVPGAGDAVMIDALAGTNSAVSVTSNQSAGTVQLDGGDSIAITNASLGVFGGSFVNNGTVSVSYYAGLYGSGALTAFTGTGSILLDAAAGPARLYGQGASQLSFGAGQTVAGRGEVGIDQGAISNAGLFDANVGGGVLTVDARGGSGGIGDGSGIGQYGAGFANTGVLQASNGGNLALVSGRIDNTGGAIRAVGAGSVVTLGDDSSVIGGSLTTTGGGVIAANSTGNQYLTDVTLTGGSQLTLRNDNLRFSDRFTNNGTVSVTYYGQLIGQSADLTIDGAGAIRLDNAEGPARLFGQGANRVTIAAGQSVGGAGEIGIDQGGIVNNGLIAADLAGRQLTLDARGGSNGNGDGSGVGAGGAYGLVNNAVLEASNGGTLYFGSGTYANGANGVIRATGAGSTVVLGDDSNVIGGSLVGTGGGLFSVNGNGNQYLTGVTLTSGSAFNVRNDNLRINGAFTNNGAVNLTYYGQLIGNTDGATIGGAGTITLDNTDGPAYLYGLGANRLTIGGGQVVQGRGNVGIDQGAITNNGVIDATSAAGLFLDARGGSGGNGDGSGLGANGLYGLVNTNLLEATGGGALVLQSGRYDNTAGTILASGANSVVTLGDDSAVVGGLLTTANGGLIAQNGNGNAYLNGATLTAGSAISQRNGNLRIDNAFTNNGDVRLSYYGSLIGDTAAAGIDGAGTITLDNAEGPARLYGQNANRLTLGSGQTVRGAGEIGIDQGAITNNGVVDANLSGRALVIDARGGSGGNTDGSGVGTLGAGFVNNDLLRASNGGALVLGAGLYDNRAGTILATGANSTVVLGDDAQVVGGLLTSTGGGAFTENGNGNQYLNGATLTAGSTFNERNGNLRINGDLTNNGTITLSNYGFLIGNAAASALNGTGTVVLDNAENPARLFGLGGNVFTIGAGQTVRGSGEVGIDQGAIVNRGTILANGAITVDARGGGGGNGDGSGVGTGGLSGLFNDGGTLAAASGGTLSLVAGRYENSASGTFSAGAGGLVVMTDDGNLANLAAGDVLSLGRYAAGAGGTLNLRSNATGAIGTIGTDGATGTDTVVALSGANSVVEVTRQGSNAVTTLDQSLTDVARSGRLELSDGRQFTAAGSFSNRGSVVLDSGAGLGASNGFFNFGTVTGNGSLLTDLGNTGTVTADGGTLFARAITGSAGTIGSNAGATLDVSGGAGGSGAANLVVNGALALGANDVTVFSDYRNANFGAGNGFDPRANVTGSGRILAFDATMDLSGPGLSGDTLNVGNVRLGGTSSTALTITNNGQQTTIRGAVESPATNTVNISSSDFVVGPNGSTTVTLSYTGTRAGSLAGQTVSVVNNFDNVADRALNIQGAAYNPAAASLQPNPIDLGAARVGGTLTGSVTITNTAPAGQFSEGLAVTGATGANGASGTAPSGLIAAGSSANSAVSLSTATAGSFGGSVTYGLATDGAGTSGLARMDLAPQTVLVNGRVYQVADPVLGQGNVAFATVRQGSAAPTAQVSVTNAAAGALTDSLNTSVGALPANVTGTAPGPIAGGQSGALTFTENTAQAGQFSGTGRLDFTSTDPELAALALPSQGLGFTGTVTEAAVARILKDAGAGALTGSGTDYFLDLGEIMAGTGPVSTDLGVLNAILDFSYDETLGGTFGDAGGQGFTFAGMTFSGLSGGSTDTGNLLTFSGAGLGDGVYTDTLTFSGYSRYAGLDDLQLGRIRVNVTARITGAGGTGPGTGAVPEPATWAAMLIGFGWVGGKLRRRARTVRAAVAL